MRRNEQDNGQDQQPDDAEDEPDPLAQCPRLDRRQPRPIGHRRAQLGMQLPRIALAHAGERDPQRLVQGRFLARLADGAADPVDIDRLRRRLMRAHPGEQIGARVEVVAMGEDIAQAAAGLGGDPRQQLVARAVAIRQEDQKNALSCRQARKGRAVVQCLIVRDHEARDVERVEPAERHQPVHRIDHARSAVHGGEQVAQVLHPVRPDRSGHHEVPLGDQSPARSKPVRT